MPASRVRQRVYSRDAHLAFSENLHSAVATFAASTELSFAAAARRLLLDGLQCSDRREELDEAALNGLAGLLAAEQTLQLLETIVPDGRRHSAQLRESAVLAAEARLAELRDELAQRGQG